MLSQENLPTLNEVKEAREDEFYVPGELDSTQIPYSEGIVRGDPWPKIAFDRAWTYPKRVKGIPGDALASFKPQNSLRRAGKELVYRNLKMIPSELQINADINPEVNELPQLPLYFMDGVPSFEEVPFGLGNLSFGQEIETERGIWGELVSSLSQAATGLFEKEEAEYKAQIKAATTPRTASILSGTTSSTFLYLLAGGAALFFLMKKKSDKVRKLRRR